MKINNKNLKRWVNVYNSFLLFLLLFAVLMHLKIIDFDFLLDEFYLIIMILICVIYVAVRGWQYFEFDTSGEGFTLIVNRVDCFAFLGSKEKKIDLPKYKLNNYEIRRGLFNDDLTLYINSRKSKTNVIKIKLRLTFLSKQNRNKIISELDKIVTTNQYKIETKVA